ncbi:Putative major facilitator, sugar transporter, major facilitator superfamily [Colletotrichum destructivum]|uniref:Major facilitator, sugar transporter, major facilitator superfamily n=1 Tax=Colletotrichum destructivum TaxID=34406 RepID=A0AAX4J2K3_9PEZI|nr:Putative major facilitator, sugar transporter, major facilitator superfamily [Colletotrichum destructivum]
MGELCGQRLVLAVSVLTSLGFMLIGYDNGLMGGLVNAPAFNSTFDSPDPTMTGLIVAIYEIGCFFGCVATAIFGEKYGRRKTIWAGCFVMVIGAVLQAAAYGRALLIVGRIVSGIGMGIVNSTVPVLQAEFSPKASRGIYVCAQLSTLNFGIFLVYWIDYAFSTHTESYAWRIPVILQCLCLLPMFIILHFIPETPRWLAAHDRSDECLAVLQRLKCDEEDDESIQILHSSIMQTVSYESSVSASSWRDIFVRDRIQSQKRFLIACAIQGFQQLGGINAIIYYSSTLFEKSIGFDRHMSSLMSGFLQTWFFVASFIPWFLIDRVGRRPLLLSMISVMAAVMAVQAALIYQVQNATAIAKAAGIGAAAMLFVFQGAFTIGFQATVWVYPSEILPLRIRQLGSSISSATNWLFNYMIVQITPISIDSIGWRTYIIFAVLNATWVPIIYLFFPETKGLELEDVDLLFSDDTFIDMPHGRDDKQDVWNIEEVRR